MLLEPAVEELVEIVGNKYEMTNIVAKRAKEIQKKNIIDEVHSTENEITQAAYEVYEKKIIASK